MNSALVQSDTDLISKRLEVIQDLLGVEIVVTEVGGEHTAAVSTRPNSAIREVESYVNAILALEKINALKHEAEDRLAKGVRWRKLQKKD